MRWQEVVCRKLGKVAIVTACFSLVRFLLRMVARRLVSNARLVLRTISIHSLSVMNGNDRVDVDDHVAKDQVHNVQNTPKNTVNDAVVTLVMDTVAQCSESGPLPASIGADQIEMGVSGRAMMNARLTPFHVRPGHDNIVQLHLQPTITDNMLFGEFGAMLLNKGRVELTMRANVDLTVFGLLSIRKVPLYKTLSLKGMDGLRNVCILSVNVTNGTEKFIKIESMVSIYNPSDVSMDMGTVELSLFCQNACIGRIWLNNLVLSRGPNQVNATVHFQPDREDQHAVKAGSLLLSNYVCGKPTPVLIAGSPPPLTPLQPRRRRKRDTATLSSRRSSYMDSGSSRTPSLSPTSPKTSTVGVNASPFCSSPFPCLVPILASLSIPCTLPPLSHPLVVSTTLLMTKTRLLSRQCQALMSIHNSFPVPLIIYEMTMSIQIESYVLGTCLLKTTDSKLSVPASVEDERVGPVTVTVSGSTTALVGAVTDMVSRLGRGESVRVSVEGELSCKVGEYDAGRLAYRQDNVPVLISQ